MAMRSVTASEGINLLTTRGLRVLVRDANTVTLTLEGKSHLARVHVRHSSPSRWDLERDVEPSSLGSPAPSIPLYVVPKATAGLIETASGDARIAVVSVLDRVVIVSGTRIEDGLAGVSAVSRGPASTRGRVAWGRFAVLRVLLRTSRSRTQMDLAAECGVSQVAISNALRVLGADVTRDAGGWRALQPESLWEQFLAEYPGPLGITSYWLGLDLLMRQAEAVRGVCQRGGCSRVGGRCR